MRRCYEHSGHERIAFAQHDVLQMANTIKFDAKHTFRSEDASFECAILIAEFGRLQAPQTDHKDVHGPAAGADSRTCFEMWSHCCIAVFFFSAFSEDQFAGAADRVYNRCVILHICITIGFQERFKHFQRTTISTGKGTEATP